MAQEHIASVIVNTQQDLEKVVRLMERARTNRSQPSTVNEFEDVPVFHIDRTTAGVKTRIQMAVNQGEAKELAYAGTDDQDETNTPVTITRSYEDWYNICETLRKYMEYSAWMEKWELADEVKAQFESLSESIGLTDRT